MKARSFEKKDFCFNLRFPGQYYDSETGFYYNFHRYYMPEVGRYLREDEVRGEWDFNLYVYVGGNPVMGIDNEGEDVLCRNYVVSGNAGVPWFPRFFSKLFRIIKSFRGVGPSGEYGTGVLYCFVCGREKCYSYEFACAGGGLGLPASGTANFEWGWWRGSSVDDFRGISGQVSVNASLIVVGGSVSWVRSNVFGGGHGETSGISSGIAGGFSLSLCYTWNLKEIDCNKIPFLNANGKNENKR